MGPLHWSINLPWNVICLMSLIYSNNQPGFKIEAIYQHCHSGGSSITQHLSINLCIIVETRTSVYKRKYGELIVLQQTYLINTLELRVSLIYLTSDLALRDADIGWISAARSQFDIRPFKFDFWISSNIRRYHQNTTQDCLQIFIEIHHTAVPMPLQKSNQLWTMI